MSSIYEKLYFFLWSWIIWPKGNSSYCQLRNYNSIREIWYVLCSLNTVDEMSFSVTRKGFDKIQEPWSWLLPFLGYHHLFNNMNIVKEAEAFLNDAWQWIDMSVSVSQITSNSTMFSFISLPRLTGNKASKLEHQCPCLRVIHQSPVDSPQRGQVIWKAVPWHETAMGWYCFPQTQLVPSHYLNQWWHIVN